MGEVYFNRFDGQTVSHCFNINASTCFFYKHTKFRIRLGYVYQVTILRLALCLTFQGTGLPVAYGKNLTPMWLRSVNLFLHLEVSIDL